MKKYSFFIFCFFLLLSCGNRKISANIDEETSVINPTGISIQALAHHPYCGGAAPSPEQEKGYVSPMSNKVFFLKKGVVNNETIPVLQKLITDENGLMQIEHLPAGDYCIIQEKKALSFSAFYAAMKVSDDNSTTKNRDEDCFRSWYERPEFSFKVEDTKKITETMSFTIYMRCFTQGNPCIYYMGPLPP